MSKWRIPRHKPKGIPEWERADRNHGKKFKRRGELRQNREETRKTREFDALKGLADRGMELAKIILGSCNRKKSLDFATACRCARSAKFESGRDIYVYECAYCGKYHLTHTPIDGVTYKYDTKEFKV